MKRRLISSALPYVNNVPHLGNLIQVLSADAFARFCRLRGYETLYICGTDEYGTATETRAAEEGTTPRELCDRYHAIHDGIYRWFGIAFDKFGRTSTPVQTEVTQGIFKQLDAAGYITEQTVTQLYCARCGRFLADRFIRGTCPNCGSDEARGDQCEACGKLLDPTDLKEPRCSSCGSAPAPQSTNHLYIDLPKIKDKLEAWIQSASYKGFWANNAVQMTSSWIRDGLRERAITRDLKWGIPVPRQGYESKVFYVWFDAPIGYISITGCLGDELAKGVNDLRITKGKTFSDWHEFVDYWWKSPDEVELFQFIGKDNIPFHTVIFPSSLLGSGDNWTMLHHMSSTEYLNYESGKFSKSRGVGVFGSDAMETGIPADVWRFYIFYNRPEKSDALFTWKDFQEKVNSELIGNLGNLVNRTLSFITRYYDGRMPAGTPDPVFWETARKYENMIAEMLERAELRDAFHTIFELSSYANKYFQDAEPWRLRNDDPPKAEARIRDLACIVRDIAVLIEPYLPQSAAKLASFFGLELGPELSWKDIGKPEGIAPGTAIKSEVLFAKLEDELVDSLRERYSGSQKERQNKTTAESKPAPAFENTLDLRAAKIEKVERHPKADKLYVIGLETGEGVSGVREERTIVSGLVGFYTEEQLLGKRIIVAYNLKPAKLRGLESRGMLLAAGDKGGIGADGSPSSEGAPAERCEVLDAGDAPTGTRLLPEGAGASAAPAEIDIDTFFSYPITVKDFAVLSGGKKLCLAGKPVCTGLISEGEVH
ncbi:MAG: methionine--tRNA ligase [Treponema sp.]|jgi:methionyl-tRNA synthetase|nr:methionine--tRNA ligase [Treponema sp.]